jgi:hypothetical protein
MVQHPVDQILLKLAKDGQLTVTLPEAAQRARCSLHTVYRRLAGLKLKAKQYRGFRWTEARQEDLLKRFVRNGKLINAQHQIARHFGCTQMSVALVCRRLELTPLQPRYWDETMDERLRQYCDTQGRLTISKVELALRLNLRPSHVKYHLDRLGIIPLVTYRKKPKC